MLTDEPGRVFEVDPDLNPFNRAALLRSGYIQARWDAINRVTWYEEYRARLADAASHDDHTYSVENLVREYVYADYLTGEEFVAFMEEAHFAGDPSTPNPWHLPEPKAFNGWRH